MFSFTKRVGTAALVSVVLLAPTAQGQFRPSGVSFSSAQNLYPSFIPTQLQQSALRNWAFNTAVIGNTYASIPPWVFGYNPYPPINYGPVSQPYSPSVSSGGYSPSYSGGYSNPYASGAPNASSGSGYGGSGGGPSAIRRIGS
jgi:hypothetical protein